MSLADHLPQRVVDPLAGSDPGFTRLLTAVRAVSGVLAVMGAETLLMKGTGALQISVGPGVSAAQAAAQHHQILVIAILLNGVIAMVSGLAINDSTLADQAIGILLLPVFVPLMDPDDANPCAATPAKSTLHTMRCWPPLPPFAGRCWATSTAGWSPR